MAEVDMAEDFEVDEVHLNSFRLSFCCLLMNLTRRMSSVHSKRSISEHCSQCVAHHICPVTDESMRSYAALGLTITLLWTTHTRGFVQDFVD